MGLASLGCGTGGSGRDLVCRAQSISEYPVMRADLIKALDLKDSESEDVSGGVRSGWMRFLERWSHPSGLKVIGYDSEYVGDGTIVREAIAALLNGSDPSDVAPWLGQPRKSFESISITTKSGRVVYDSKSRGSQ